MPSRRTITVLILPTVVLPFLTACSVHKKRTLFRHSNSEERTIGLLQRHNICGFRSRHNRENIPTNWALHVHPLSFAISLSGRLEHVHMTAKRQTVA